MDILRKRFHNFIHTCMNIPLMNW